MIDKSLLYSELPRLNVQIPKTQHKKRVTKALLAAGYERLAEKISKCRRYRCSSLWCDRCRQEAAEALVDRMYEHVWRRYGDDETSARERLIFVTPLFALVPLSDPARVQNEIRKARKLCWKALKRKFPKLWWQGAFELELIDLQGLGKDAKGAVKRETIATLASCDPLLLRHRFVVLVHAHVLLDCGDYPTEEIRLWFKNKFYGDPRLAFCMKTRADQTLEQTCLALGSYPFKDRVQYNPTFQSPDYQWGRYFTDECLADFVKLHDVLMNKQGVRCLLIYSGDEVIDPSDAQQECFNEFRIDQFLSGNEMGLVINTDPSQTSSTRFLRSSIKGDEAHPSTEITGLSIDSNGDGPA